MNNKQKTVNGFTLIELLVVVLIIGILAAVALPQYQKAVIRSRYASLVPLAKALNESNEAYYMEHGVYATNVSALDVTSSDENAQVTLGNEYSHKYVRVTRPDIKNRITMYQQHSVNFPHETHCEALIDDAHANWLCRDSLKGILIGNKYGYTVYSLSENTVGSLMRVWNDAESGLVLDEDRCVAGAAGTCRNIQANAGECIAATSNYSERSCNGGTYQNGSVCESSTNTSYACRNITFKDSTCKGYSTYGCGNGTFDHSTCEAYTDHVPYSYSGVYACEGTFKKASTCYGYTGSSCRGTFIQNSVCNAQALGACSTAEFDETSYCAGDFCPDGAPAGIAGKIWYRDSTWETTHPSELRDKEAS